MLGGGIFTVQNKVLPGAYINFVSAAGSSSALAERGIVAVPLAMGWGPEKEAFEMTNEEFLGDTRRVLGYTHDAAAVKDLREIFCHATKCIIYRLNAGEKAKNDLAVAKYSGIRGNDLKVVVAMNADNEGRFDVTTLLEGREVDKQTVAGVGELKDNAYVAWKKDKALEVTAGMPLSGGSNGEGVTGEDHAAFLEAMETCSFNILCCPVTDDSTKAVYAEFTKRMRDESGIKFQTVMYRKSDADYEGVISVENMAREEGAEAALVYWASGAEAACKVNRTNDNMAYDGEYALDVSYSQQQLMDAIAEGKYILHRVNGKPRVLMDINTLVSFTEEKKEDFRSNQTIRVLDQIGNDIAVMFNTQFFGKMPNDPSGRVSLWNSIVSYVKGLAAIQAIEEVEAGSVSVSKGETKRAVVVTLPVVPVNCMNQLYMTVMVR